MPSHNYQTVLQKIKSLSKDFHLGTISDKSNQTIDPTIYISVLNALEAQLIIAKRRQEEYSQLQELLQKEEASNRSKIAFQQQMRHFCDALKAQIAELEQEKSELLENSKEIIRSLKKTNEQLYSRLHSKGGPQRPQRNNKNISVESHKKYKDKLKGVSLIKSEYSDPTSPRQVAQIRKTEVICPKTSRGYVPKLKTKNVRSIRSISQASGGEQCKGSLIRQNGNTYQVPLKTDRELLLRKKNRKKNHNLTEFAKEQRRQMEEHLKSCYLKGQKIMRPTLRQKEKIANRSVNSMISVGSEKGL